MQRSLEFDSKSSQYSNTLIFSDNFIYFCSNLGYKTV